MPLFTPRLPRTLTLLLGALLLAGCATIPPPGTPGMIYDDDGRPVSGVDVSSGGQLLTRSDINGRFVLSPLPAPAAGEKVTHVLDFTREGYEPGRLDLDTAAESQPGNVLYLKMPSRDQLLKQAWAALDRSDFGEAGRLIDRAAAVGKADSFWALTKASLLLLDPDTPDGALQAFLPDLLAEKYGPLEDGWKAWWTQKAKELQKAEAPAPTPATN